LKKKIRNFTLQWPEKEFTFVGSGFEIAMAHRLVHHQKGHHESTMNENTTSHKSVVHRLPKHLQHVNKIAQPFRRAHFPHFGWWQS